MKKISVLFNRHQCPPAFSGVHRVQARPSKRIFFSLSISSRFIFVNALSSALCFAPSLTPAANLTVNVTGKNAQPQADAVVYATPATKQAMPLKVKDAVIDQVDKEFMPLVSVIQTGTAVHFPNKDNIRHHVYSFSPTKIFALKLYAGTPSAPVIFDKPGEVVLGCNIHDHMLAYVYVVDTPYFAKTGQDGVARIEGLGDGSYDVRVWHPNQRMAVTSQTVKLKAEETQNIKFDVDIAPRPAVKKE